MSRSPRASSFQRARFRSAIATYRARQSCVRQGSRDPHGRGSGICSIDVNAGLAEHLAENGGIGRDDRKAGILGLQQRQSQAFVMRGADEQVGGVKQLIDQVGRTDIRAA